MNFLKKLFIPRKDVSVASFWEWFMDNEKSFYRTVKNQDNVDKNFMGKLFPQLQSLNPKFYCLTGMYDKQTVELIVTTESDIKSFVFAEELISAAPVLEGWRFTALTPPTGFHDANIDMDGYRHPIREGQ